MIFFMYYMGFTFTDAERSGAGLRGVSRAQRGQPGSEERHRAQRGQPGSAGSIGLRWASRAQRSGVVLHAEGGSDRDRETQRGYRLIQADRC